MNTVDSREELQTHSAANILSMNTSEMTLYWSSLITSQHQRLSPGSPVAALLLAAAHLQAQQNSHNMTGVNCQ